MNSTLIQSVSALCDLGPGIRRDERSHIGTTSNAIVRRFSSVVNGTVPCHM